MSAEAFIVYENISGTRFLTAAWFESQTGLFCVKSRYANVGLVQVLQHPASLIDQTCTDVL